MAEGTEETGAIEFEDRLVARPLTYSVINNDDGTITLVPAPGTIEKEGTPINSLIMNELQRRIYAEIGKKVLAQEGYSLISDTLLQKLTNIEANAQVNKIEMIKVGGVAQEINKKIVDITIPAAKGFDITALYSNNTLGAKTGKLNEEYSKYQALLFVARSSGNCKGSMIIPTSSISNSFNYEIHLSNGDFRLNTTVKFTNTTAFSVTAGAGQTASSDVGIVEIYGIGKE